MDLSDPLVGTPQRGGGTGGWCRLLPDWAYERAVGDVARGLYNKQVEEGEIEEGAEDAEALPLQCVTGPPVKLAMKELVWMWSFALLLPWPVLYVTPMPKDTSSYAKYPMWIWCFCGPILYLFLREEYQVLKYTIIPQVQVVQRLYMFGKHLEYPLWLLASVGISLLCHMDLVTNGLFLAVSIKTAYGEQHQEWEHVWYSTWRESLLTLIPYTDRYLNCVIVVWIMMFIQPLHAMYNAFPVRKLERVLTGTPLEFVFYKLKAWKHWQDSQAEVMRNVDLKKDAADGENSETLLSLDEGDYVSVKQVKGGTAAVMYTDENDEETTGVLPTDCLKFEEYNYEMQDAEYAWEFVSGGAGPTYYQTLPDSGEYEKSDHGVVLMVIAECNRMASISMMRDAYVRQKVLFHVENGNPGPAFGLLRSFLTIGTTRIWLFGLMESALLTNLQGTLLAMNMKIDQGDFHYQLAATLVLSILVALKRMWDAFWRLEYAYDTIFYKERSRDLLSDRGYLSRLKRQLYRFSGAFFVYFLLIEYVIFKCVAMWKCPEHMWNIQRCANIDQVEGSSSEVDSWMFWLYIVFALLCLAGLLFPVWYKGRMLKKGHTFNIPGDDPDPEDGSNTAVAPANTAVAPPPAPELSFNLYTSEGSWELNPDEAEPPLNRQGKYKYDKQSGRIQDAATGEFCGRFSTQGLPESFAIPDVPGEKLLKCIAVTDSEIMVEIQKPANKDAFFVLPSQLNGAEYQSYEADYIVKNIDDYQCDNTGGPRGQLAVHPAAGQFVLDNAASDIRPAGINSVADVLDEVNEVITGDRERRVFELQNGYLKIPSRGGDCTGRWKTALRKFKMLVMEDVPASGLTPDKDGFSKQRHCVNLVYGSAVPVKAYNNEYGDEKMQIQIAESTLVTQYYGALSIAARRGTPTSRQRIYLMPLGGGVFCNPPKTIVKSMSLAVEMLSTEELDRLDVHILTFHRNQTEVKEYRRLLGEFKKLR